MHPEWPSDITGAPSWASLPVEVRQNILRLVGLPTYEKRYDDLGSPKVALFATVCREWQVFFEARTFRRLVLDDDSLSEFDAIVRHHDFRLGYIRKLWLRIQLAEYECPDCDVAEDKATQRRNNMIFTRCIQSLLGTLELWDAARHGLSGLALMLSASSPSDSEHRFSQCEIRSNYPYHYVEDLDLAPGIVDFHRTHITDPFRRHFHRGCPPPLDGEHIKRVQGTPLRLEPQRGEQGRFLSPYKTLPAVPMVKGLVMRRQFRRGIHVATLSWLLSQSFVALEWFRFERSISMDSRKQVSFDKGFQLHLLPSLPKTLRQFSFTQWETPQIEHGVNLEEELVPEVSRHAQVYLSREMAKLSQRLEQFSPQWQMDTAAFLQSITELNGSPNLPESSLKRVILRCLLSSSDRARQDFESLVIRAAKAALSLPRLEVLELWGTCLDGEESCAYIFRYIYEGGRVSIVWMCCEDTKIPPARIIAKWSEAAEKHLHSTLAYNAISFTETKAEILRSEGTCIYRHLMLRNLVLDPITQIILENEPYNWGLDDKSASLQQGNALNSNPANPNALYDHLLMEVLGPDTDFGLLQADLTAFDAAVDAFVQQHH